MNKMKKVALGVSLAMLGATSAQAALIGQWDVEQEFEFVEWTDEDGNSGGASAINASGGSGTNVAGVTKLDWGTPSNPANKPSSLVINPEAGDSTTPSNDLSNATIDVGTDGQLQIGQFKAGPVLFHNNFTIIDKPWLDSAVAEDYVTLTSVPPGSTEIRDLLFDINYKETINAQSNPPCSWGGAPDQCADIFTIAGESFVGAPVPIVDDPEDRVAFEIDQFVVDDYLYTVYIRADGLEELSDDACNAAGVDNGCVGLITEEQKANEIALFFAMEARQIPEPGAIALLGLGLAGLGGMRRRRKSA